MTTDEDVKSFLEHHGVKGMKWGVRKKRDSTSGSKSSSGSSELDKAQAKWEKRVKKQRRQQRVSKGLAIATVAVSGARLASTIMAKNGRRPASGAAGFGGNFSPGGTGFKVSPPSFSAIPMGPIGSTSIPRINGGIPMSRIMNG